MDLNVKFIYKFYKIYYFMGILGSWYDKTIKTFSQRGIKSCQEHPVEE
ncbi:MAG: hypothetical protein K0S01_2450 [Herbinix sp.]|jgi:hypothetical protein|nr:hypothetical protein [Herbinix sp.]